MIAPEGKNILGSLLIISIIIGIATLGNEAVFLNYFFTFTSCLFLFSLNFFRDPVRKVPEGEGIIVSPADGKIVLVKDVNDPDLGRVQQISIFLNVFNVHANRIPIDCIIEDKKYQKGRFKAAFNHKASDVNEQTEITLNHNGHLIKVKQIAGLIARRILCYAEPGKSFLTGDRLGFIMFGSRTDLLLPSHIDLQVSVGEKVKGTETIIGHFTE